MWSLSCRTLKRKPYYDGFRTVHIIPAPFFAAQQTLICRYVLNLVIKFLLKSFSWDPDSEDGSINGTITTHHPAHPQGWHYLPILPIAICR